MKSILWAVRLLALVRPAIDLSAQVNPYKDGTPGVSGYRSEVLAEVMIQEDKFLRLAEAVPADKYILRPAPGGRSRPGPKPPKSSKNQTENVRPRRRSNNLGMKWPASQQPQSPLWGHRRQHCTLNLLKGLRRGINRIKMARVRNLKQLDRLARL